jgi:hypothetical protein
LSMELYHSGVFGGSALAKLSIFVSEYEFWCHCRGWIQIFNVALFRNMKYNWINHGSYFMHTLVIVAESCSIHIWRKFIQLF